jgi:DNA gyrase subunit A
MANITEVDILDESKECFLTYSSEVLTDRAVPAAEDGLLSAQRKILWTMEDYLKMDSKSKTKKCNALVGSTLATSYFHGDQACYGVLCKMSQEFLMRYPLITGQGSLGTQESNDMKASSRYTEAKPSIYADLMMGDYKKNVVPTKETYNGEFMEPVVLPSLFPNAICNGRQAIGVALSHSSVPHNLTEACNAIVAYIEGKISNVDELMQYMKGPDFPLGGTVINSSVIREAFRTGKSKVSLKVRGNYEVNNDEIIFTTIPYRTYRDKIKEQINKNVEELEKYFDDFSDESNVGKNRLVFKIKSGVNAAKALNVLFAKTDLQTTVSYNMNYIVNGTPKLCSMLDLVDAYVKHQTNVLLAATKFDKEKAEARAHILRGLLVALDKINEVIELIKKAEGKKDANAKLVEFLGIDEIQANAILDMKLAKLTRIDKQELVDELRQKEKIIEECVRVCENESYRNQVLIQKVTSLKEKYGDERRTKLADIQEEKPEKAKPEIVPEDCVVNISKSGYIKRIPSKSYKTSRRNTVGAKNEDVMVYTAKTNTVDTLLIFSSAGKMYRLPVIDIPEATNATKGLLLTSLVDFEAGESAMAYTVLNDNSTPNYVFFGTADGTVKKAKFEEFTSTKHSKGVKALKLREGNFLTSVDFMCDEDILLISKRGMIIRFATEDMPLSSRTAMGVKGIKLNDGDELVACVPIRKPYLAVVTADGHGKLVDMAEFNTQGRGGKGVKCTNGVDIGGVAQVDLTSDILITGDRSSVRVSAQEFPQYSKMMLGNLVIKNNDTVTSITEI